MSRSMRDKRNPKHSQIVEDLLSLTVRDMQKLPQHALIKLIQCSQQALRFSNTMNEEGESDVTVEITSGPSAEYLSSQVQEQQVLINQLKEDNRALWDQVEKLTKIIENGSKNFEESPKHCKLEHRILQIFSTPQDSIFKQPCIFSHSTENASLRKTKLQREINRKFDQLYKKNGPKAIEYIVNSRRKWDKNYAAIMDNLQNQQRFKDGPTMFECVSQMNDIKGIKREVSFCNYQSFENSYREIIIHF